MDYLLNLPLPPIGMLTTVLGLFKMLTFNVLKMKNQSIRDF